MAPPPPDPYLFRDDFAGFRRLGYWEQWDHLVAFGVRVGNRSALPAILFHAAVFVAHLLAFRALMARTMVPFPDRGAAAVADASERWHSAALKNTVVWTLLANYLGLSLGYVGPLYGELGWRLSTRRFATGIPVRRGWLGRRSFRWLSLPLPATRRWFDVAHAVALVAVCVLLLLSGADVPPWAVWLLAALALAAWALLDAGAWLGLYGMQYHWPLAWLLQTYGGAASVAVNVLPCFQLWLLAVYVLCALAKVGPWWDIGHANEWTTPPPFAGRAAPMRLFLRDAPAADFRATAFARAAALGTVAVEGGAPLLLLLGGDNARWVGAGALFAMHAYIVGHFAHADVYSLNWLAAHCLYFCHVHRPRLELGAASPAALALLALELGYALWGQLGGNAHRALQSYCYKYWSGNYR